MAKISDLVEYFKLEAEFDAKNNCTIQTSEVSVKSPGRRKIRLKKRWNRVRQVGHGGSGAVWLEALEDDPGEERAVKEILKDKDNTLLSSGLDYYRELLALGNLSKVRCHSRHRLIQSLINCRIAREPLRQLPRMV